MNVGVPIASIKRILKKKNRYIIYQIYCAAIEYIASFDERRKLNKLKEKIPFTYLQYNISIILRYNMLYYTHIILFSLSLVLSYH